MTWLWQQNPPRHEYSAAKINGWARQLRGKLTIPHELACVTDTPEGIDPDIRIIKPPGFFEEVKIAGWGERTGAPQCYRRLALYHPDAAEIFGAEWIVQMDADMIALRNMDDLFTRDSEFRIFNGTAAIRPYNGGLQMLRAGARVKVWEEFSRDPTGVATASRKLYVGSDQAAISMILGKGERTWGEADGVYYHSPRVVRLHQGFKVPPTNMRVLFFPGDVKPWNGGIAASWMKDAWDGKEITIVRARTVVARNMRMRFRAYADPKGWGNEFARAAMKRNVFCTTFTHSRSVHNGAAFVRLDQQGQQRDVSKRIVEELNTRGVITLPTLREARWYDDKGAQLEVLGRWMPKTLMITDANNARDRIGELGFPFVSKAVDGSASKCVRLIRTERQALAEIDAAFRAPGIETVYGRKQYGYVYWQQFIPDNDCDYRVCVTGDYIYGLVRRVRPGGFTASGSGDHSPLTLNSERELAAARLCIEASAELNTDWMAYDVVFDADNRPLILEMSSAWTMKAYHTAQMFSRETLKATEYTGAHSFTVAVEILERMWKRA
jgi:glutathione synthase/RimK-type ligase-like ATP-grasp enzyme